MEKVTTKAPKIERFTSAKKQLIAEAIKTAVIEANNEREATKNLYSEEALRYIVAKHISKLKIFGTFPNRASSKTKLVFEMEYHRLKTKDSKYRPDIASVTYGKSADIASYNLAVELKITPDVSDIQKCRNYISSKHGRMTFKLAICIVTSSQRGDGVIKKILDNMKGTMAQSNLLFCSIEKTTNGIAPVVIWLKD